MGERKIPVTLNCGLDLVGEVLYGKWKIRLLFFINEGNKRPSELQRKIPDATPRVLNMQLKELEEHEMISKVVYAQMPPKVEYSLTEFGKSLMPVVLNLGGWADANQEKLREIIERKILKAAL
jgi:DNA-binding HxlR family transcriptional regulator